MRLPVLSKACKSPVILTLALTLALTAAWPQMAQGDVIPLTQWTRTYNSPDNGYDGGYGVAVHPKNGSVYVSGYGSVTGEAGNVWLRKYDSEGSTLWTRTYNGDYSDSDFGNEVAVSPDGKAVYVAGITAVGTGDSDIWVRKYSAGGGDKKWTRTARGNVGDMDWAQGVAVSPNSRGVYVAGFKTMKGKGRVAWLRKYSRRGKTLWTKIYNPGEVDEMYNDVAVGPDGSVYTTGFCQGCSADDKDAILLRKYSPAGRKIWAKKLTPGESGNVGNSVAVAPNGSVYVTGTIYTPSSGGDFWIKKYSSGGKARWSDTYDDSTGPSGILNEEGFGVTAGSDGSVFVAGYAEINPGAPRKTIWVRKYSGKGVVQWTTTYDGGSFDMAHGVAVGSDGRPVVTGETSVPGQFFNIWVRKYRELITLR
jgi:hypothetical protein